MKVAQDGSGRTFSPLIPEWMLPRQIETGPANTDDSDSSRIPAKDMECLAV